MPSEQTPAERREVTVRRAPRYVPFLILGALVGAAAAALVAFGLPASPEFEAGSVFGFFLVMFAGGGAILGAVAALILDRRSVKRQQRAVVEAAPETEPGTGTDPGPDGTQDTGPRS